MFKSFRKNRRNYSVGETLILGKYPQTENCDIKPIEWLILDIFDNIALLISKYCIIPSGYCDIDKIQTDVNFLRWENSLAREICNGDFYNLAFGKKEKQIMCKKTNQSEGLGNTCDDFVFLLYENETKKYFPTIAGRVASATEYAVSKGTSLGWGEFKKYSSWWLMPQHSDVGIHYTMNDKEYMESIYPKAVFFNGEIGYHSRNVYHSDFAIRPCIQINLKAYKKLV